MKIILDTNIYISWIREKNHQSLLLNPGTQKYLSSSVLLELWAGAKTKNGTRIIEKLQYPYQKADRIILLIENDYIMAGQIISDLPGKYKNKINLSSFLLDIFISLNALKIGAYLFTENKQDFKIIEKYIKKVKIEYV